MAKQDTQIKFSLVDGVSKGLKSIVGGLKDAGESITFITEGASRFGSILATVSGTNFLTESVSQAADLEDAIARVGTATGASAAQLAQLKTAAQDAAIATRFSFDDTAGALEALAREGLSAQEAIAALPDTLNLAQAANIGAAEAAGLLADSLGTFGEGAAKSAEAANLLAAGALKGGTSVSGLFTAITQAGPAAAQLGLTLRETVAGVAALGQSSIEGGRAGKALREVFVALQDPTSQFSQELTRLGITSRDFGTVITQLAARGKAGEAAIASLGTGGTIALRALLKDGGSALEGLNGALASVGGAAAAAAAPLNNTLNAAIERVQERFATLRDSLVAPLFEPLSAELESVFVALTDFAASPAFAEVKLALTSIFIEAATAVKEFLSGFNFKEAETAVADFAKAARENFDGVIATLETVVDAVRTFVGLVRVAFNGLDVAVSATIGAVSTALATFMGVVGQVSDSAAELAITFEDIADRAFKRVTEASADTAAAFKDTAAAATDLVGGADAAAGATTNLAAAAKGAAEGLVGVGTAAATTSGQIAAVATAATETATRVATPIENLRRLQKQISDLYAAGAKPGQYLPLIAEVGELEKALNEAAAAQAAANDAAAKAAGATPKIKEQGDATRDLATAQADVATAAADTATAAADGAQAAQQQGAGIQGLLASTRAYYQSISDGALAFFDAALRQTSMAVVGLFNAAKAIEEADTATRTALDNQKQLASGLVSIYDGLAASTDDAAVRVSQFGQASSQELQLFAQRVREGDGAMGILAQKDLDALAASAERAADRIAQIEQNAIRASEQLSNLSGQLQDELDRAAGNDEAIAKRKLAQRIREIDELATQAGESGRAQAEQSRRQAQQLYEIELRQIRQRRDEQIAADNDVAANRTRISGQDGSSTGNGNAGGGLVTGTQPAARPQATPTPTAAQPQVVQNISITGVIAEDINAFVAKVAPAFSQFNARQARLTR